MITMNQPHNVTAVFAAYPVNYIPYLLAGIVATSFSALGIFAYLRRKKTRF